MAIVPRTTGPHVVHFSAVKEVVEIESGRFEFFKQMLAVGLAGIAGIAAIFTDADKIPADFWSKGSLIFFGVADVVVVLFSAMGISTYANHLRDVEKLSRSPNNAEFKENYEGSGKSIITHAQVSLVFSGIAALALIAFAGGQLFKERSIDAEAAMRITRNAIAKESGITGNLVLDRLAIVRNDFEVSYLTGDNKISYKAKINRDTNKITEISKMP